MLKRILLLVLLPFAWAAGCGRTTPAGFWSGYRPELIDQRFSDQGPWGGVRWITWTSPTEGAFRVSDVLSFAESKGWSCREPTKYSAAQLRQWQFAGQYVFPLHFGPADRVPDNAMVKRFPRSISDNSLISACRTGWIRVEPGTEQTRDATGYIQIEESGTRMAIYHLWGEI